MKICTAYELDGRRVTDFPSHVDDLRRVVPVYETLPGWQKEISARPPHGQDLPAKARAYLDRLSSWSAGRWKSFPSGRIGSRRSLRGNSTGTKRAPNAFHCRLSTPCRRGIRRPAGEACRGTSPSSWTATAAGPAAGLAADRGPPAGVASVRRMTEECARLGIEQLTLYCLSSENWKRPPAELDFLMQLLEQYMVERAADDHGAEHPRERDRPPRGHAGRRFARDRQDHRHEPRQHRHAGSAWRSTTAAGPNWSTPCRAIAREVREGRLGPTRSTEEHARRPSVHGRHARPRPADPHGRRDAGEQFSALADQLCRNLGDADLLARVRRRICTRPSAISPPATAASAASRRGRQPRANDPSGRQP